MSKITYLLGAGASFGQPQSITCGSINYNDATGLPIINSISRRFQMRSQCFRGEHIKMPSLANFSLTPEIIEKNILGKNYENLKNLYEDLLQHYDPTPSLKHPGTNTLKANRFSTIDTYMKTLYHTKRSEFEKLKLQLDQFFILEQLFWEVNDDRYLNFLSTISNLFMLPENINFISWNYDFLFESYGNIFRKGDFTYSGAASVTTPSMIESYPSSGWHINMESAKNHRGSLLHLNGRCGLYLEKSPSIHIQDASINLANKPKADIVDFVFNEFPYKKRLFTFAWENINYEACPSPLNLVDSYMSNTEILVIIGYSFPFFNRKIDEQIINTSSIKNIVYQQKDQITTADTLRTRFKIDGNTSIDIVNDCNQFYIPSEL